MPQTLTKIETITYGQVKSGDLLRVYDNEVSGPYKDLRVTSCHRGKGANVFLAYAGWLLLAKKQESWRCYRVVSCACSACNERLAEMGLHETGRAVCAVSSPRPEER